MIRSRRYGLTYLRHDYRIPSSLLSTIYRSYGLNVAPTLPGGLYPCQVSTTLAAMVPVHTAHGLVSMAHVNKRISTARILRYLLLGPSDKPLLPRQPTQYYYLEVGQYQVVSSPVSRPASPDYTPTRRLAARYQEAFLSKTQEATNHDAISTPATPPSRSLETASASRVVS